MVRLRKLGNDETKRGRDKRRRVTVWGTAALINYVIAVFAHLHRHVCLALEVTIPETGRYSVYLISK